MREGEHLKRMVGGGGGGGGAASKTRKRKNRGKVEAERKIRRKERQCERL